MAEHDKKHTGSDYDHLLQTNKFLKWFWNNPEDAIHHINLYKGKSRKGKWPMKPFLRLEIYRPTFYCVMSRDVTFIAAKGSEVLEWRICRLWFSEQGHSGHEGDTSLEKVHDAFDGWFNNIQVHQFVHIVRYLLNHLKDGVDEIKVLSKYADRVKNLKTELKELKERVQVDDSKESENRLLERILRFKWTFEDDETTHSESESESEDDEDEEDDHKTHSKSTHGGKPHSPRKLSHVSAHHSSPQKGHENHSKSSGHGKTQHHPVHHKGNSHHHKEAKGDTHEGNDKHGVEDNVGHEDHNQHSDYHPSSQTHKKSAKRKLKNLVFDLPVQDTDTSVLGDIEKDIRHKVGDALPEGLARELELQTPATDYIFTTQNFINRIKTEMKSAKGHASTRILQDGHVIFRRDLYFKHPSVIKTAQVLKR